MSNSDDGFPNGGDAGGSEKPDESDASGMSVPRPSGGIGDDLDLGDVDFDSIFGTGPKVDPDAEAPKVPRLPPPLSKTPERPSGGPPSLPKPDPPPPRQGRHTLLGLNVSSLNDAIDNAGISSEGPSPDDDFASEKTQMAPGLAAPSEPAHDEPPHRPVAIADAGDDAFSDLGDDDPFADLGEFDSEKTNVAPSPLEFPEDQKGLDESSVDMSDFDADDKTEVGMSLQDMLDEEDKTELGVPMEMPIPQPAWMQSSQSAELPEPIIPDEPKDSFDEEPAPELIAPTPTNPGSFGFSNFDPATHGVEPAALPAPILADGAQPSGAGEFPAEKTELLDSPFTNEPQTARIHVLEGPCAGQEFFVNNLRNTLGRATNNTICVADVAMSRQHLEIVNNGDGTYLLRDLQSINGTALNGTRIREGDIFHGDRFEAGKSVFQFVVAGSNVPPPTNRRIIPAAALQTGPGPMHAQVAGPPSVEMVAPGRDGGTSVMTKIALAAAVVSVFIILGVGFLWIQKQKNSTPAETVAEGGITASSLYLEGVEAVKNRKWDAAERSFQKARMMDSEIAGVDAQLERIANERGFKRVLGEARDLLDEGERSRAVEMVSEIPRESVYYDDGQRLLRENKKLTVEELYTQASAAFGRDDLELAEEKIAEIREIVPEHEGATSLEERIAEAKEKAQEQPVAAKSEKKTTRRRPKRKVEDDDDWGFGIEPSGGSSSGSGSTTIVNFTKGYSLYRNKKFSEAISFFNDKASSSDGTWASRASKTAKEIKNFKAAYDSGNSAYSSGSWSTAEKQLIAARRIDKAVASNGYFSSELGKKIAGAKAKLGSDKLDSGDFSGAFKYAKDAKNYDSSSRELRELNSALSRKAKSLYVQAANERKTDPNKAAKLCRTIMSMTPSSDDSHKKAKALLKEL